VLGKGLLWKKGEKNGGIVARGHSFPGSHGENVAGFFNTPFKTIFGGGPKGGFPPL